MKRTLLFTVAVLICVSCGGQKAKKTNGVTPEGPAKTYVWPDMPAMISDPAQQADWIGRHYWDNFRFTDTLWVAGYSNYTEQAFADYIDKVLVRVPLETGNESIGELFRKAAVDKVVFWKFSEIAEKYLFDPNSPYRNDEYYIATLEAVLANPALDEWERIRPQEQLRMSLKNRVGTPAADFRYTLASGATGSLYGLRSLYTLLFFNNPGCPACRETMMQITGSPFLSRLVEEGSLTVLAIYSDEDLAAWREHAVHMPAGWINSYDRTMTIKNDELYDLKAIPTLYLLDRDKKVVLKDVMNIPLIEETIYAATSPTAAQ